MIWLGLAAAIIVLCFGFVLLFGAPYLPTLSKQINVALQLADLKPGQTLLELGCGDGKVLVVAAKQGLMVVGYELNPLLAFISWLRTRRYRKQVKVIWGNFWTKQWPPADGIFVFALQRLMPKLDKKIVQEQQRWERSVKLASFTFTIPGRTPAAEQDGVYLYKYKQ